MQISEREEDWILNLLTVRDEVESKRGFYGSSRSQGTLLPQAIRSLRLSFEPQLLQFQALHAGIQWLQDDFSVYIVNLFETFHAFEFLGALS